MSPTPPTPPIPDGTAFLLKYNTSDDTETWNDVSSENGLFSMPALVQMYDCIIFVKGTSFVGQQIELNAGVSQGRSTGVADDGNTKFTWRITSMPTQGEIWVYSGTNIENIIQWP